MGLCCCSGFLLWGAEATFWLWCELLIAVASLVSEHRLNSWGTGALFPGMWNLPGPGIEPKSPALAGGFSTTDHQGSPNSLTNSRIFLSVQRGFLCIGLKKEFIGPGLHFRPVHADHARPPFQWTLNSVFSAYENNNRRIRPPPDRGTLKTVSRLLIA